MDYLAEQFGAWQASGGDAGGTVRFKLFFPHGADPHIRSIQVAGDFQEAAGHHMNWDFDNGPHLRAEAHPEGTLWSLTLPDNLPMGFYQYKYLVTFDGGTEARKVTDPFTRYGGREEENAGFVIGGSQPADNSVEPVAGGRKLQADLIVYELMIDDFTDEYRGKRAPMAAVEDKLDHLQRLGVNAILFMPWTAWQHSRFNWGYDPYLYFSVEYRYVTALDELAKPAEKLSVLKRLISACHRRGIHVIMDGVFNHVSPSFPYREFYRDRDDCPYTGLFDKAFSGLRDLNFNNPCTRDFVRDVCLYWIAVFGIDGIRFDNTVNFHIRGDDRGLPDLLEDIQTHLAARGERNFTLTLEHMETDAVDVTKSTRATSYWDNLLHDACFTSLWQGSIDSHVLNAFNNARWLKDHPGKAPTIYIANHDHSHVAWRAGARGNEGSNRWYKTQPWAIALLTAPGIVMLQNGQEFGEDQWVVEDDHGSGRRVQPRPLRWGYLDDAIGGRLFPIYRRLCEIRNAHVALRSDTFDPAYWEPWQTRFDPRGYGVDVGRQLVIYRRWGTNDRGEDQQFVIALNFSDRDHQVDVPFPMNGEWTDLLSSDGAQWGTWRPVVQSGGMRVTVNSNWGRIFHRGT